MNDPTTSGRTGRDSQEVTVNESTPRGPASPRPDEPTGATDLVVTRLRAADPAASSAPDLDALRTAVRARTATVAGSTEAVHTEEDVELVDARGRTAPVDELAQRRRRTGWPLRVAAVAAGALVVGGGGGYAIGAAGGGGDDASIEPAIAVGNPFGGQNEAAGAASDMALPEAGREAMGGDASMPWPGYWGRTVFSASGLGTAAGTARAWAFDPASAFTAGTAAAAAAALGVSGEPREQDMMWFVGPQDGTGPAVQVFADGTASLSFYDPTKDAWFCASPGMVDGGGADGREGGDVATDDAEEGVVEPMPVETCEERDLGPAPQGRAAEDEMRRLLAALGEDPDAYQVVAEQPGDERWSYVMAHHVVDGQRTGLAWGASFTGAGLQSLNGALAELVDLGDYPVVSPQAAVERLGDPRFGSSGGPVAYRDGSPAMDLGVAVESPRGLPQPPSAGSAIRWPISEVTITEARLGLGLHGQPDGATMLLPTYELTGADGSVWSPGKACGSHPHARRPTKEPGFHGNLPLPHGSPFARAQG
ncbi:MAG: hypothetical protein H5T83_08150, partial [Actinotalea sp.]|nr:hypothetical protein [Actinotalea sp.]